jgi:hypothetical protein
VCFKALQNGRLPQVVQGVSRVLEGKRDFYCGGGDHSGSLFLITVLSVYTVLP